MSLKNFQIILEKIRPYAKSIALFSWGEPLLNPDLLPIIRACSAERIQTTVHSNLSFKHFDKRAALDFANSGLSHFVAAIDGISQENYEKYRKRGDLELVLRNLRWLSEARQETGSSMKLTWKYLVNGYNENEMDEAKVLARKLQVDILFKPMRLGSWADKGFNRKHFMVPLQKAQKDIRPSNQEELGSAASIDSLPLQGLTLADGMIAECVQPFSNMHIHWNGDVFPCCNVHGNEYSIGNLLDDSFEELWNGEEMRHCRQFVHCRKHHPQKPSICEALPCPMKNNTIVRSKKKS